MRIAGRLAVLFALIAVLVPVSEAVPVVVISRAALGGTDSFDWGDLGPSFTALAEPVVLASTGGTNTATVEHPGAGGLERRDQGNGWNGNFAPGDELIWTQDVEGSLDITFDNAVFGAGAQIQRDTFGAFNAQIDVYDALGAFLISFNIPGISSSAGDNSAIFLGVLDTSANIGRIVYNVDGGTEDFAINQLDIVSGPVIPEPGTLALLGAGLLGLGLKARRRRG